jgi:hypothetical protein
MVPIQ